MGPTRSARSVFVENAEPAGDSSFANRLISRREPGNPLVMSKARTYAAVVLLIACASENTPPTLARQMLSARVRARNDVSLESTSIVPLPPLPIRSLTSLPSRFLAQTLPP